MGHEGYFGNLGNFGGIFDNLRNLGYFVQFECFEMVRNDFWGEFEKLGNFQKIRVSGAFCQFWVFWWIWENLIVRGFILVSIMIGHVELEFGIEIGKVWNQFGGNYG